MKTFLKNPEFTQRVLLLNIFLFEFLYAYINIEICINEYKVSIEKLHDSSAYP